MAKENQMGVDEQLYMSNSERIWNVVFLAFVAAFIVACHHMEWYVMASVNSVTFGVQLCTTLKSFRS